MGNKQGKDGTHEEVGHSQGRKVSSGSEASSNDIAASSSTAAAPIVKYADSIANFVIIYGREIPFVSEIGGGKGWPSDVNVVLYHHAKVKILIHLLM